MKLNHTVGNSHLHLIGGGTKCLQTATSQRESRGRIWNAHELFTGTSSASYHSKKGLADFAIGAVMGFSRCFSLPAKHPVHTRKWRGRWTILCQQLNYSE